MARDIIDDFSGLGSIFDWISPLVAEIQDVYYGPHKTFLIPHKCGRSGRSIVEHLRRHGITTWGHMIVNDRIMISVKNAQVDWAKYLLAREGISFQ